MAMCPFSCGFVFRIKTFSPDFLSRFMKRSWVNFFFSPVMMIVDWGVPILLISCRVLRGFGMFCRRVTAKTWLKVLFWKGG